MICPASLSIVVQRCESACDVFEQCGKGPVERRAAGHDDIVADRPGELWGGCGKCGFQSAPDAVADDGVADLLRDGEAESRRGAAFASGTLPHLDQECRRGGAAAAADGQEFRSRFEGLQDWNSSLRGRGAAVPSRRDKLGGSRVVCARFGAF